MTGSPEQDGIKKAVQCYVEAWNTADDDARRALLELCWADHGVYVDPQLQAQGRDKLDRLIRAYHQHRPGLSVAIASVIDDHHKVFRFVWTLTDAETTIKALDVGEVDARGMISRITRFFGAIPPER